MNFSNQFVRELVQGEYGIECQVKALPGYVDLNFLIKAEGQKKYLLKICKPETTKEEIDFQIQVLHHLKHKKLNVELPEVIPNLRGVYNFPLPFQGDEYNVRLHSWVDGRMVGEVNPRTNELFFSWGETCGELSHAFHGFDHAAAHRFDEWNPIETLHSKRYLKYITDEKKSNVANHFWNLFEQEALNEIPTLRRSVNHSDAHEYNLLVQKGSNPSKVTGVIDFGDAIAAPTICELAIACAYTGMFAPDPILAMCETIKGYHSKFPVEDKEIKLLYYLIGARLMISVSHAALKYYEDPKNEYHQISAGPAWELLFKLKEISPDFALFSFRAACGKSPHPNADQVAKWMKSNPEKIGDPVNLKAKKTCKLDLSVGSISLGNNSNFETVPKFSKKISAILEEHQCDLGIGGYGEVRPFYTTDAYKVEGYNGPQWRTMHLATDFWTVAGTEVLAMADGTVHAIRNNDNPCDYGPTVILKHKADSLNFFSLYGHLSLETMEHLQVGQRVKKGEIIAWIGHEEVNGGWPPHLHFQIMLDLLGNDGDFPGVAFVHERDVWMSICPTLPSLEMYKSNCLNYGGDNIIATRQKVLGKSLSVSYKKPLHMVRGYGIHLYDDTGRRYIDTVNNVAHVGHEHPRIVRAAQRQFVLLNTNTRYLHKNIIEYAEKLLAHCPPEMEVVYFVNSGSEANELALRMAKTYAAQEDMIALEVGYHGNTGACIDISSYKFDGKGGSGAPEFTSICRMPNTYRGEYKNAETAGPLYAEDVKKAIQRLKKKGRNVAGFIAESILSCGGQVMLPSGYLADCYSYVRAEGGLCIADEVQVGFGRVGSHFWAFELQDVVPDIITCGKPIGNGHPMAAVITTRKVAEVFANGMEYFNTFGGNPVSCAIGHEVLSVVEDEKLQENAKEIGNYFIKGLQVLKDKYLILGDVRGIGLFLGFELVKDRKTLDPAAEQATYLVNRMRDLGILMSTDGPLHNVIKIKPPMCIKKEHVDEILKRLDQVFAEDFMRISQ